jgi:hypothetical protein
MQPRDLHFAPLAAATSVGVVVGSRAADVPQSTCRPVPRCFCRVVTITASSLAVIATRVFDGTTTGLAREPARATTTGEANGKLGLQQLIAEASDWQLAADVCSGVSCCSGEQLRCSRRCAVCRLACMK